MKNGAKCFSFLEKNEGGAIQDGVLLNIISAFRSVQHQIRVIERKLNKNIPIEDILKVNTPPGYSEHHTGQAIDISDGINNDLSIKFQKSEAFDWPQKMPISFILI